MFLSLDISVLFITSCILQHSGHTLEDILLVVHYTVISWDRNQMAHNLALVMLTKTVLLGWLLRTVDISGNIDRIHRKKQTNLNGMSVSVNCHSTGYNIFLPIQKYFIIDWKPLLDNQEMSFPPFIFTINVTAVTALDCKYLPDMLTRCLASSDPKSHHW